MAKKEENTNKKNTVTARWLYVATAAFVIMGFVAVGRIAWIRYFWEPDPRALAMDAFKLQASKHVLAPKRGDITDCKGRLLAITIPTYTVELDCAVRKKYFRTLTDVDKKTGEVIGVRNEREWRSDARKFARGLPEVLGENGHTAEWYEREIFLRRDADPERKINRTLKIADNIDYTTLLELKKLPLADRKQHIGGVKVTAHYGRKYPYGKLARRTIGYVRSNDEGSRARGIEGSFNYELHGEEGVEWRKMVDDKVWVLDTDSSRVPARDGRDVRLTLDIDIQDIADRAIRKHIENDENIADACMIVMEVKTGAVKAMVNLHKEPDGKFDETLNIALTRATEPGSVFKTVGLMTMLEDRKVRLDTRIPTNGGVLANFPKDEHIRQYEAKNKRKSISVVEGLEISANYVFAYLALEHYRNCPKEFVRRYYDYGFGKDWQFDIKGMARASIPNPDSKGWTNTDLGALAYGYASEVTPLHTLAFYNAIANKGNLVKPHVVEAVLENGEVVRSVPTVSLNKSICSRATADTLTRALRCVVTEGTGSRLKSAKCSVAGKTGTARMMLDADTRLNNAHPYESKDGRRRNQGSFVGFFPAEDPVYSAIVVVYSKLSKQSYYGGTRPAEAFKEVVNEIYALDPRWRPEISGSEAMPPAKPKMAVAEKDGAAGTPSLKGLGLDEALYLIENSGYRCKFSGVGHVASQSPAAGTPLAKGGVVTIVLK